MPSQPFDPIKYQNEMQGKAESNGRWNATQANSADLELCNSLMLLDTVLLTASGVIIANDKIISQLNKAMVVILILASVAVVLSIFAGMANYITLVTFQSRWSRIHARLAAYFSSEPLSPADMSNIAARETANIPDHSNRAFWYCQIGLLIIALALYLTIIIGALAQKL
jgi:hypothetical protein